MVVNALIRMAATRAKGRALRDAVGHGEALAEEIGEISPAPPDPYERPQESPSKALNQNFCSECGVELLPAQVTLTQKKFGRSLCRDHQRAAVLAEN
jgi:hypothetical protein